MTEANIEEREPRTLEGHHISNALRKHVIRLILFNAALESALHHAKLWVDIGAGERLTCISFGYDLQLFSSSCEGLVFRGGGPTTKLETTVPPLSVWKT